MRRIESEQREIQSKGGRMSRATRWNFSILVLFVGLAVGGTWMPCAASSLPDFTLDPLADGCIVFVEGSEILQGKTVEVRAVVANATGVSPATGIDVLFEWRRLDKQEACGFERLSLQPFGYGGSAEVSSAIDTDSLLPGTYEVTVAVDPEHRIPEEDETNNACSVYLTVLPVKPELRPLRFELTTASPVERGETTGLIAEIENTGDSEAGEIEVLFELAPVACTDPETGQLVVVEIVPANEDAPDGLSSTFVCDRPVETDLDVLAPEATFVAIGSAFIPGLAHGTVLTVEQVLDSAAQLDDLLADILLADDENPDEVVGSLTPLGLEVSRQLSVLRDVGTVYAVRATIRLLGGIPEQDPDNNVISTYMTIVPSELNLPELRPVEITLTHDAPVEWRIPNGPTVGVTVTVVNVGGSIARPGESSIIVRYYVRRAGSGVEYPWEPAGDYSIPQIAIEEELNTVSAYREIRFGTPGDYEIRAEVDATQVVSEVNEDNNSVATGLTVQGAELHPIRVELGAAPIRQGDTVEVVGVIENTGRLTVETFTVGFYVDGSRVDTAYYQGGGLAQDERVSLRGYLDTTDLPASTYTLRVVVDPDGRLPDNDRLNNEMRVPFRINEPEPRLAELHPTGIEVSPPSPLLVEDGSSLSITARIKNTGSIDTGHFQAEISSRYRSSASEPWGSFHAACSTGESSEPFFCVRQDIDDLARNTTALVYLDCDTEEWPSGLYEIRVRVDPPGVHLADGEVPEQDESNNEMIVGFRIGSAEEVVIPPTPYPNIVFKSLRIAPTQDVDARQAITIEEAVVWNAGQQEADKAFDVTLCWQLDDGPCVPTGIAVRVPGLAGETETDLAEQFGTVESPATPGLYQLIGMADALYEVDERGREADNGATASAHVTGMVKPDLTIDEIWFSVDPPLEKGSSVTAYARVRNLSKEVGASAFDVRLEQLDGGPVRDVAVSRLGPGATLDLSFGLSTSALGDFAFRVTADVENAVTETDDRRPTNNNTLEEPFSVVEAPPVPVEEVANIGGDARYLIADEGSDVLYAASSNGRVVALLQGEPAVTLFDVSLGGGEVVALGLVPGVALYVAVAASPDVIHVLNPATGESEDEITLFESMSVTCMTAATDGTVYVGTSKGMLAIDPQGNLVTGSGSTESVVAITVDSSANLVYVISASTFYSLTGSLEPRCALPGFQGTLTSLAVGPSAIYVGTEEGNLFAYAPCNGNGLVRLWQYPQIGSLGSAIAAVVVDPSDFDPIYVAVQDGRLFALDSLGQEMWSYTVSTEFPQDGFAPAPVWDARTGRVFIVDTGGMPYVLDSRGIEVFAIDASASSGTTVGSSLVIDEYTIGTGSIERLVRVYYYGGNDGAVYMIRTER